MQHNCKVVLVLMFALVLVFSFMPIISKTFADETVTNAQMLDMCDRVTSFITTNGSVPNYISTVSGGDTIVSAADFHYMMARWLRWYKNNSAPPASVSIIRYISGPANPTGVESGTIQKADILAKGQSNADFIESNNQLPNYSTVGSTQYTTKAMFSVFARTINWYQDNGALPNYATVSAIDPPTVWNYGDTGGDIDFIKPTDTFVHNSLAWGADWSAWGSCYICGKGYKHCGVDVDAYDVGRTVKATESGTVKVASNSTDWNWDVVIEHTLPNGSKVTSLYYHLRNVTVSVGDTVSRGQKIGEISDIKAGNAYTVPHLHFGIRTAAYSSTMSQKGALPTCSCLGYTWPEYFVDPTNYVNNN